MPNCICQREKNACIVGVAVNGRYLISRIDIREGEARFTCVYVALLQCLHTLMVIRW